MTLATVRQAFADTLNELDGIRAEPYQTDQVNPPGHAMISVDVPEYDLVFARGADLFVFTIWVFDQRVDERSAQIRFDELVDPSSEKALKNVLDNSADVLELVDYVNVRSATSPRVVVVGTVQYLMTEFRVEVVIRPEET